MSAYLILALVFSVVCGVAMVTHTPEAALWTIASAILCVAVELERMNDKEGDDE